MLSATPTAPPYRRRAQTRHTIPPRLARAATPLHAWRSHACAALSVGSYMPPSCLGRHFTPLQCLVEPPHNLARAAALPPHLGLAVVASASPCCLHAWPHEALGNRVAAPRCVPARHLRPVPRPPQPCHNRAADAVDALLDRRQDAELMFPPSAIFSTLATTFLGPSAPVLLRCVATPPPHFLATRCTGLASHCCTALQIHACLDAWGAELELATSSGLVVGW